MSKFIIKGGATLSGAISVNGAKNAALKMLAGSILSDEQVTITNIPNIKDVQWLGELVEYIGGEVEHNIEENTVKIQVKEIRTTELPEDMVRKTRSSVLVAGALLARAGHVRIPHPGGDAIGQRPIDFFLNGFKKMGATVEVTDQYYDIRSEGRLQGCSFFFPKISHTATESLMMTAALAEGTTTLLNAATEPEVVALAESLNEHGAKITGAGTHTITIEGVERLGAGTFETIPDRIETGTFAIMGALCADELVITNCAPENVEFLWYYFDKVGIDYELGESTITVRGGRDKMYKPVNVQTHEYPGFATDLQAPFTVLLTQCHGMSMVHETIFDGRLFYTDLLTQMGAQITMCDPHRVIVNGPATLHGRKISSPDIRAGMALVLAALLADGQSEIDNIYHIDRGYADLATRLQNIGAQIERIETE